jgi:hypothetical protein
MAAPCLIRGWGCGRRHQEQRPSRDELSTVHNTPLPFLALSIALPFALIPGYNQLPSLHRSPEYSFETALALAVAARTSIILCPMVVFTQQQAPTIVSSDQRSPDLNPKTIAAPIGSASASA